MIFVQARNYTKIKGKRKIDLIVMHDVEALELEGTAENIASYFARTTREASAHYCVDSNSEVQCVRDNDVAYAAPGANHDGLHVELAGFASQSRAEWLDEYGKKLLPRAAALVAAKCKEYGIPIRALDAAALKRGERGITTHAHVSEAFKRTNHWDPGPNFPMDIFIDQVRDAASGKTEEDDVPLTEKEIEAIAERTRSKVIADLERIALVIRSNKENSVFNSKQTPDLFKEDHSVSAVLKEGQV